MLKCLTYVENFTALIGRALSKGIDIVLISGWRWAMEIIQMLRIHYLLRWLLNFAWLACSIFFCQRQIKPDKNKVVKAAIKNQYSD